MTVLRKVVAGLFKSARGCCWIGEKPRQRGGRKLGHEHSAGVKLSWLRMPRSRPHRLAKPAHGREECAMLRARVLRAGLLCASENRRVLPLALRCQEMSCHIRIALRWVCARSLRKRLPASSVHVVWRSSLSCSCKTSSELLLDQVVHPVGLLQRRVKFSKLL